MTMVGHNPGTLGIHADSETDTITVQVDQPVDSNLLARIKAAVAPLIAVHPAKVELLVRDRRVTLEMG